MNKIFTLFLLLISASCTFAQRVNYPPAPSSVYALYGQNEPAQLKSTLWFDDISVPSNWSFANTSIPINDWFIETDSTVVSVSGPFESSTSSNGFLVFKTDTSQGATSDAYAEYVGATIDLTGQSNVRIQFEQQFISDSNERVVEVSQDGITWFPFVVSDGFSPTGEKVDDLASIDISASAGNALNLLLRFHYTGESEGYWAIDDIKINSIDSVDLRAVSVDWGTTGAWGVRMPYYSIWSTQIQPIEFCAIVENSGLTHIDSAMYDISVDDAFNAAPPFNTSDVFSIQVDEIDTVCLTNTFTPSFTDGHYYDIGHSISSSLTEQNLLNNSLDDESFVLGQLWSQYYGRDTYEVAAEGEIDATELCEYEVGNVFDIFEDKWPYAMEVWISPNTQVGTDISGKIYKFDTITNGFVLIDQTFTSTVSPSNLGGFLKINFAGLSNEPFLAGTSYLITANAYGGLCGGSSTAFGVSGKSKPNTSFLIDLSAGTLNFSYLTETPIIGLVTPPEINWGLQEYQSIFNFIISPNPSNQSTTLSFDLSATSNVNFEIIDLSGKSVWHIANGQYEEGTNQLKLNTSNLGNGVYFIKFTSDFGSTTKRIAIQH